MYRVYWNKYDDDDDRDGDGLQAKTSKSNQ